MNDWLPTLLFQFLTFLCLWEPLLFAAAALLIAPFLSLAGELGLDLQTIKDWVNPHWLNVPEMETAIAKKARDALLCSIFGALGLQAIVFCPLAFVYATQALHLIDKHMTGEEHRIKATMVRAIATIALLFYTGFACLAFFTLALPVLRYLLPVGNR